MSKTVEDNVDENLRELAEVGYSEEEFKSSIKSIRDENFRGRQKMSGSVHVNGETEKAADQAFQPLFKLTKYL
jgi:hypothetical protein